MLETRREDPNEKEKSAMTRNNHLIYSDGLGIGDDINHWLHDLLLRHIHALRVRK
jgi:hypothetical protein